jgi:transposase
LLRVLFIGDDWAEDHHDVEIEDEDGRRLARARLPEGLEGITRLHALVAEHAPASWAAIEPQQAAGQVVVGIETGRGPWVTALRAAGYQVFAINPLSAARYRQRHSTSGAKSDAGDAHVLAEIVRLDRDHYRPSHRGHDPPTPDHRACPVGPLRPPGHAAPAHRLAVGR